MDLKNEPKTFTFNPELLSVETDEYIEDNGEATKILVVRYTDADFVKTAKKALDLYGNINKAKGCYMYDYEITTSSSVYMKLRRRPNSKEYTQKSLEDFKNLKPIESREQLEAKVKACIDYVNERILENFKSKAVHELGQMHRYEVRNEVTDLLEKKIAELEEKYEAMLKELRAHRAVLREEQRKLILDYVQTTGDIAESVKPAIIDSIKAEQPADPELDLYRLELLGRLA